MEKDNLEKLEMFLKREKWTGYEVPESDVERIEILIQQKFPITYRRFLLITGQHFRAMPISNGFSYLLEHNMQLLARKNLKEYGISLKSDEFWVFAENEGAEVIFFFYFDEGDDPPVYVCEMAQKEEDPDYPYLRKSKEHLSDFFNYYVDLYDQTKKYK
ncbi:MAG: SMI1/KNR4 family protein [Bacteroidetes bacterium]|nr:MAG: SMI1/KNR4 family protein [Bacteroidota bacterium]